MDSMAVFSLKQRIVEHITAEHGITVLDDDFEFSKDRRLGIESAIAVVRDADGNEYDVIVRKSKMKVRQK